MVKGFDYITHYAPARIVTHGAARLIAGSLIGGLGVLAIATAAGGGAARASLGGLPEWCVALGGAVLVFTGACFISGAIGCIISASAKYCSLAAGPGGMIFDLPEQGWFGRFRVVHYYFAWHEVKRFCCYTHRILFIPVSTEFRIEMKNGKTISIPRHYFAMSSKKIYGELEWYDPGRKEAGE